MSDIESDFFERPEYNPIAKSLRKLADTQGSDKCTKEMMVFIDQQTTEYKEKLIVSIFNSLPPDHYYNRITKEL